MVDPVVMSSSPEVVSPQSIRDEKEGGRERGEKRASLYAVAKGPKLAQNIHSKIERTDMRIIARDSTPI